MDMLCRRNYKLGAPFTVGRRVQPEVTVYPEKTPALQHRNLLLCLVTGFYPGDIKVTWFRNGQEQREGVMSTGLIRNGDWTFQTTVMLPMTPELGEVYTCLVDHPSLPSPVSVDWSGWSFRKEHQILGAFGQLRDLFPLGAQSEYSWRKMLSGAAAFLVGLVFFLVGIAIHIRDRKGRVETPLLGNEVPRAVLPPQPH